MNVVKVLVGIFTVVDGKINLLVNGDFLPEIICNDNIENELDSFVANNLNINRLDLQQCYTFSEKTDDGLLVSIMYTDIVNFMDIKYTEFTLVPVEDLFESKYIEKLMKYLKKNLILNSTIKKLYPKEFVLPEIQKLYEDLLGKKYDRRNFRKRLIKLDVIEDLNKMSINKKGRPAKLYRFKDITEDKILF